MNGSDFPKRPLHGQREKIHILGKHPKHTGNAKNFREFFCSFWVSNRTLLVIETFRVFRELEMGLSVKTMVSWFFFKGTPTMRSHRLPLFAATYPETGLPLGVLHAFDMRNRIDNPFSTETKHAT